jgi:hypothetical protein
MVTRLTCDALSVFVAPHCITHKTSSCSCWKHKLLEGVRWCTNRPCTEAAGSFNSNTPVYELPAA